MKAYRIYSGRKQDALELIEHTVSNPTAHEVRVRVARYPSIIAT
jgi:NADPH:quinone reductase-like Zn-dependent oxidoreductase